MKRFARPHVPEEELHAYADNQVSGGQRAEIAEHLMGCLICRAHYAEIRDLRIRTSEILSIAVPKIPAALQANRPAAATSQRVTSTTRRNALLAAGLVVTVLGTWVSQPAASKASARASLAKAFVAPSLFATSRPGEAKLPAPSAMATFAPGSVWRAVSWEAAQSIQPGALPHIGDLPLTAVRLERSPPGDAPGALIRHLLPDGTDLWVVVGAGGSATSSSAALARLGFALHMIEGDAASGRTRVTIAAQRSERELVELAGRVRWPAP